MKATVTTTITTDIDIETFEPDHRVELATSDDLPEQVVRAAAIGGCKAVLRALGHPVVEDNSDFKEGTD